MRLAISRFYKRPFADIKWRGPLRSLRNPFNPKFYFSFSLPIGSIRFICGNLTKSTFLLFFLVLSGDALIYLSKGKFVLISSNISHLLAVSQIEIISLSHGAGSLDGEGF
jgi:hypothetical protein